MIKRYSTPAMDAIWGEKGRNRIEREIWIAVMKAQVELGVPIPAYAIADYEQASLEISGVGDVELERIAEIERETRHDLYARMRYFNGCAGHEYIHWGLTSADIVENATQIQVARATVVIADHVEQVVLRLLADADQYADVVIAARTHGQPAQTTTLGKRIANWTIELVHALVALYEALQSYDLRGIKGAVGDLQDMVALLESHGLTPPDGCEPVEWAAQIETSVLYHLGIQAEGEYGLTTVGQCYPRSHDLSVATAVLRVAAACNTIAVNLRLLNLLGQADETNTPDQVGSSAMPHKSNPRYAERIHGLTVVARGYHSMLAEISGGMWFEGDVTTSSTRRVALPGLFQTVDAILANTAYVLDRTEVDHGVAKADVSANFEKLASGRLLAALMQAGMSRGAAHEKIRLNSAALYLLGADPDVPLTPEQIREVLHAVPTAPTSTYLARMTVEAVDLSEIGPLDTEWPGELI